MKRINQIREYRVMELEQSHVRWGAQEDFWEEVTSEQRHECYEEPPGKHDSAKALGYKGDGAGGSEHQEGFTNTAGRRHPPGNKAFNLQRDVIDISAKAEAATHSFVIYLFPH